MNKIAAEVIVTGGMIGVVYGMYLIWPPLAWVSTGLLVALVGAIIYPRDDNPKG